ncbi:MAG: AI-2E family transporter [Snowella sp.]|nr:AI-2E family transporter [Snowella sp.]
MKLSQWLGLSSVIIAGYLLWQIRQLLLLVFMAIVLTTALNRLVRSLERFNIQRKTAVILTFLTVIGLTVLFFWLIVPPFIEQFQNLLALLPKAISRLRAFVSTLQSQELESSWLPNFLTDQSNVIAFPSVGAQVFRNFFAIFSNSVAAFLRSLFVLALTVMMLLNPQGYRKSFLKLFPAFYRRRADEILTLSEAALGNWLTGTVINCIFIGLLSGLGLWVLQIKLVLVHALMAGILNFIPNLGPAASVVFPIMIALLDEPWKIWAVLVLYFIIQNIESYWLTPIVMAKQVSLLPAVTLIAQIFFASTFGILGLLLALPLTVVAKTWLEEALFKDLLDQWQTS